jgi:hypothetical protein
MIYEYKAENSEGVEANCAHEFNRTDQIRSSQRYIKRIKYGNRVSHLASDDWEDAGWIFEVVMDYGEHAKIPSSQEVQPWPVRPDPFSSYRSCFETRTYRLCQRILMFHHFPDEPDIGSDCLVASLDLSYQHNPEATFNIGNRVASFVASATQHAYERQGSGYIQKALPPLEFEYSLPVISDFVHDLDESSLENVPSGVDGSNYRWVDLNGEGIAGILTQQAAPSTTKPIWERASSIQ